MDAALRAFFVSTLGALLAVGCGRSESEPSTGQPQGGSGVDTGGVGGSGGRGSGSSGGISGSGGVAGMAGAAGSGASSGGDNCPGINFRIAASPNARTSWCIGLPSTCGGLSSGFTVLDAGGALTQYRFCQIDCASCTIGSCPPMPCVPAMALTSSDITPFWDGTHVVSGRCGSASTACLASRCATPGQYQAQVCGFVNPDPNSTNGCASASSDTDLTCAQVSFDYPPASSEPVVITMPAQP